MCLWCTSLKWRHRRWGLWLYISPTKNISQPINNKIEFYHQWLLLLLKSIKRHIFLKLCPYWNEMFKLVLYKILKQTLWQPLFCVEIHITYVLGHHLDWGIKKYVERSICLVFFYNMRWDKIGIHLKFLTYPIPPLNRRNPLFLWRGKAKPPPCQQELYITPTT